jgi:DNA modification methylase
LPTAKVGEKTEHPTSKPTDVFAIPMRQHARPGEVCYEPFSGSGSQIIAGEAGEGLILLENLVGMHPR